MKNVLYGLLLLCAIGGLVWAYNAGYKHGSNAEKAKTIEVVQQQEQKIVVANQKILDTQRIIANNSDECFDRVWPDEVIRAANP